MTRDMMDERRHALEDEFFHKQDQEKLAALKDKLADQATKEELRKASGMTDDDVLDKLVHLGLTSKTVAALSLVPLITVAWADGEIQDNERDAILHGAAGKGMEAGTPGHALLSSWLAKRPDDALFAAWEGYIKSLTAQLNDEQIRMLKKQVTNFCSLVAGSAGGFLGIGKVSGSETKAMERIEAAFGK
ncbi:MAG: hypothetical protein R3B06_16535 [Kofleriaceae bacterium]